MHKILLPLSLMLLLASAPAQAAGESCFPSGGEAGYVQLGDDIILTECPAMEGEGALCTCHAPPGEDGECRIYPCTPDGEPKVEKPVPPPLAQEEKAAPPPKAEPANKKRKISPPPEKPAPAAEEKKAEVPPVPEEAKPVPAPAPTGEKKIEYTR
ncbi:MAG: hypothetical protein ACAH83_07525 [Alphaproteobacteria bacterium]